MEGFFIAAIQQAAGLGSATAAALLEHFSSAAAVWKASAAELAAVKSLSEAQREALLSLRDKQPSLPEKIAAECKAKGISICTLYDEAYPSLLKEIFRPPLALFYRGQIEQDATRVAIVGARKATPYGKSAAESMAREIAAQGITVVSGAAFGIDTASHKGALQSGRTVAVLGCGVDVAYPASNRQLLEEIAENGAVISEYAPGTRPLPAFFPARNRIISGLSRGTLVVEAAERSGSLITAEMALSEGRDVFAVPGSIFSDMSRGCNRLIQQGAKLVQSAADVLDEYIAVGKKALPLESLPEMNEEEKAVWQVLSVDVPLAVDEIIYKLNGSNASNIAFLLLQMELKGVIVANPDHTYCRRAEEGKF